MPGRARGQLFDFFGAEGAGFGFEEDGDAVAHGVGKAGAAADEFVFLAQEFERAFGDGANEQLQEFRVQLRDRKSVV